MEMELPLAVLQSEDIHSCSTCSLPSNHETNNPVQSSIYIQSFKVSHFHTRRSVLLPFFVVFVDSCHFTPSRLILFCIPQLLGSSRRIPVAVPKILGENLHDDWIRGRRTCCDEEKPNFIGREAAANTIVGVTRHYTISNKFSKGLRLASGRCLYRTLTMTIVEQAKNFLDIVLYPISKS